MAVQTVGVYGTRMIVMYDGKECTFDSLRWVDSAAFMDYLRDYDKRFTAQTTDKTPIWEIIEAVQAASKEGGR